MESDDEDRMTAEQKEKYLKQGFDVEYFDGISDCCIIRPLICLDELPILNQKVESCSEWAIRRFNSDNNTNYQFVEVLKENSRFCAGDEFYLTFTAKDDQVDADGYQTPVIFQALVYAPITGEKEYYFCRPKLKSLLHKVQGGVSLALWCSINAIYEAEARRPSFVGMLDCTCISEEEQAWWCALSDPSFTEDKIVNDLIGMNGDKALSVDEFTTEVS
ncbi:hypothetical protein Acr_08g0014040 [Actinidia rufa]|uniref:Cystatin domain-containing protein n=1 Tax=Actinidia rufa TaxID=165716 RepID=A0A7J0F2U3_9ERIC|nr:hypothetical protein Acr_08g0014040 [Actinidia rufa]